ncbi:histidine kinase, partial [Burkholderia multivorans]
TTIPLYLDSIGTVMIGALAGPAAGAFTGILSNLIWGVTLNPSVIAFTTGAAFIGAAAGWAARLGAFRTPWFAVLAGAIAGVPTAALAAPVAAYVFGGGLGTGTGSVVAILQATGQEMLAATMAQSLFSDVLDKAIIFALAYVIVRSLPRRILDRYPFTGHSLSRRARAADQR